MLQRYSLLRNICTRKNSLKEKICILKYYLIYGMHYLFVLEKEL